MIFATTAAVWLTAVGDLAQAQGQGRGGGPPNGGGDEGFGNNLSVPTVFAEGRGILGLVTSDDVGVPDDSGLRPLPGEPMETLSEWLDPATAFNGTFPQQTESHWRASVRNGTPGSAEEVVVNWSDNLINQTWTTRSVVRVETVLYQDDPEAVQTAYEMVYLLGEGPDELWGTTGATVQSTYNTVFSVGARLKIEKLNAQGGVEYVFFNSPVGEGFDDDGPGGYSAEINVSGNLIYGYNWMLGQADVPVEKEGRWRLTFCIDDTAHLELPPAEEGGVSEHVDVDSNVILAASDASDLDGLYSPVLDTVNNCSTLEVEIVSNRKGGRSGGGQGNNGGQGNQGRGGAGRGGPLP